MTYILIGLFVHARGLQDQLTLETRVSNVTPVTDVTPSMC